LKGSGEYLVEVTSQILLGGDEHSGKKLQDSGVKK
jgi:hypothetical protein